MSPMPPARPDGSWIDARGARQTGPTLHAHGFVRDGRVSGVEVTMYDGPLHVVANILVDAMRAQGHVVNVTTTRPIGTGELVAVDLDVTVNGVPGHDDEPAHMWHRLSYPQAQWYAELMEEH